MHFIFTNKSEQVSSLLVSLAKAVNEHECGCVRYLVLEQRRHQSSSSDGNLEDTATGGSDIILFEEWVSQDALNNHHKQQYLKEHHKVLENERLVRKDEDIKFVEQRWGFESR